MKVAIFGTALLVSAVPAFGQVDTTLQPSPSVPDICEAAITSPGIPRSVVVLTLPAPALPAGDVPGVARSLGTRATMTRSRSGMVSRPSSRAVGVVSDVGTPSGIGSIGTGGIASMPASGIGSIGMGGIGSMPASGIGSIGMGGVGSIGSSGLAASPTQSSLFTALPLTRSAEAASSSAPANASARLMPGAPRQLPFFCP